MFPAAYVEYTDYRDVSVKSNPAKTGQTIFKWHGFQFHHISVKGNKVDFLLYDGIIVNTFPLKKPRNEVYNFLEKHWEERIKPFCEYIKKRREDEVSPPHY